MGLTGWESNDDYERYVTMYDALTYKDMFVSLDLLSNNMSGQQCKLPLPPRTAARRRAACLPPRREIFCRLPARITRKMPACWPKILNSVVHIVIIIASCLAARQ